MPSIITRLPFGRVVQTHPLISIAQHTSSAPARSTAMPRPATRHQRNPRPRSPKQPSLPSPRLADRKQLAQQLSRKSAAQPLQDSDDSDRLVVKGPGGRTGGYLPKNEIYASGGVGKGDKPGSHPTRAQRRKQMIQAAQGQQRADSSNQRSPPQRSESRDAEARPVTAPSSATRPTTAQPTPAKENSILDGIRPRRRQHSILQASEAEGSSLGLTDDSFALPDDESTPLNASKAKATTTTPSSSASRKRKLGPSEPVESAMQTLDKPKKSPAEPALPPQPLSTLRASGQKQRPRTNEEDESVMAPPMSSSSSNSPAKPKSSSPSKLRRPAQQPATLLTSQLQALMMPTKRRKTTRARQRSEFDIPEDSDSPAHHISEPDHEDSSFLPTRRKRTKSRPREKDKDQLSSRSTKAATKSKQNNAKSKAKVAPAQAASKSNISTRLTLSRSAGNKGTKSPSQHSTTARTPSVSSDPNGGKVVASSGRERRSGGSPLKELVSMADIGGKENRNLSRVGEGSEVLVEASDEERDVVETKVPPPKKARSKWDEIDAWDMDFEEVEVWERSSEKDAR